MKICKNCNIEYQDNMKFCPECGNKLESKPNLCPNCGTEYKDGQKYCAECGTNLKDVLFASQNSPSEEDVLDWYKEGCEYEAKWNADDNDFDLEKAVELWKKAAEYGSYKAMKKLADFAEDIEESDSWYMKCIEIAQQFANNGDIEAMFILGELYDDNYYKTTYNPEKARKWFIKAVETADSVEAMLNLADHYLCYEEEDGKAAEWYEKAANTGSFEAMLKAGDFYLRRDKNKSVHWYKTAAAAGSVEAMLRLAELYDEYKEDGKAAEWYEKAANTGSFEAMLKARDFYQYKDRNKSVHWYEKAAATGSVETMLKLIKDYLNGSSLVGYKENEDKAIEWCKKAANSGSLVALGVLGDYYMSSKNFANNTQKAMECYAKVDEAGPEVMKEVAKFYEVGFYSKKIEKKAKQKAIEWYIRATKADLKSCDSYERLESLYWQSNNYQELLKLYEDSIALKFAQFSNLPSKKGDCYIGMKMFLQAENYYKQGILAGDCMAYKRLGDINFWGFINPQNYKKAYEYYMKYIELNKSDDDFRKWLEKYYDENGRIKKEKILSDCHESDFEELISHRPWDSMDKQRMTYRKVDENRLKGIDSTTSQTAKDSLTTGTNDVSKKDEYHDQGNSTVSTSLNSAIDKCIPNVFFIKAVGFDVTYLDGKRQQINCGSNKGEIPSWTGTGFLLADGRFVTARHVVEAWSFPAGSGELDDSMVALNIVANNGGKVVAKFVAISSNGTQIHFTSDQCTINHRSDKVRLTEKGAKLVVADIDDTDYAYFYAGRTSGLPHNNAASTTLARGTKLVVLGFPLGIGANSANDINPILGSGIVAAPGLQNGVILTTDTNYEQGNSGGPVFITNSNGDLEVIGLVSAGAGRTMGFIVPIAAVK